MAVYNTSSDSANTMVRAFLTKVGESYIGHGFNTRTGKGREIWDRIRQHTFKNCCAFCGITGVDLQIEHLIMFNRDQCGLHHPGNMVPVCARCNKRGKYPDTKSYFDWTDQLKEVCQNDDLFNTRRAKIIDHINTENYPELSQDVLNALRAITNSLYQSTASELERYLDLFQNIDSTLIQNRETEGNYAK